VSTHTYPTADTRPHDAEPTYQPTLDRQSDREATTTTATVDCDDDSWVTQCQSQFDSARTDRLANLVDEANQAMPTGTTGQQDP
jgi:hypothetical protein